MTESALLGQLGGALGVLQGWSAVVDVVVAAQQLWDETLAFAQLRAPVLVAVVSLGVAVTVLAATPPASPPLQ